MTTTNPTDAQMKLARECAHCKNGWFDDQRFGCDVECVNGILIDIDTAHEGWQKDVAYPVAPCHPMFAKQESGDESFPNDCQQRLDEWSSPMRHSMPNEDDINRARLVFAHLRLTKELDREAVERSFMAHRQATEARAQGLVEALTGLEPYLDAIICFASTMDEHEPNRLAFNARQALATWRRT